MAPQLLVAGRGAKMCMAMRPQCFVGLGSGCGGEVLR